MAAPTSAEAQLALRLRQLRESLGLTQKELAQAFSAENSVGAATISSWENQRTDATPPQERIAPYARLIAAQPYDGSPKLIRFDSLGASQAAAYDELLYELNTLWEAARGNRDQSVSIAASATYRSWFFDDDGPATIIVPDAPDTARGPLDDRTDPNYTEAHTVGDLDALIELFGAIRAENDASYPVRFSRASAIEADDLSGHLVLLGGIAWNDVTSQVLRSLTEVPVRQIEDPALSTGEIFAVGYGNEEQRFLPRWSPTNEKILIEDVGLLVRVPNPYNSGRTLTLCNGIHSRGVLGAVRALTDARLRDSNESYLAERFPNGQYAVLVRVPVVLGKALSPDLRKLENRLYEWPPKDQ